MYSFDICIQCERIPLSKLTHESPHIFIFYYCYFFFLVGTLKWFSLCKNFNYTIQGYQLQSPCYISDSNLAVVGLQEELEIVANLIPAPYPTQLPSQHSVYTSSIPPTHLLSAPEMIHLSSHFFVLEMAGNINICYNALFPVLSHWKVGISYHLLDITWYQLCGKCHDKLQNMQTMEHPILLFSFPLNYTLVLGHRETGQYLWTTVY